MDSSSFVILKPKNILKFTKNLLNGYFNGIKHQPLWIRTYRGRKYRSQIHTYLQRDPQRDRDYLTGEGNNADSTDGVFDFFEDLTSRLH